MGNTAVRGFASVDVPVALTVTELVLVTEMALVPTEARLGVAPALEVGAEPPQAASSSARHVTTMGRRGSPL